MVKEKAKFTSPANMVICNDPIPTHRASPGSKYEPLLSALKIGQAIKCEPGDYLQLVNGLRSWIKRKQIKGTVRSMSNYGDGMARVWLVALPAKSLRAGTLNGTTPPETTS